ncbi:ribosomal protein S18 acetylase RimI-like enzyme [Paenibacillus sp. SORGH_AS306]|uniref:GNAT family N-acetyltransferase n=1 Tax=unclassified Paenibacillus TaxID=185978 RepID=UPI002365B87E|nr:MULTISPECIES: GNAT family N-acetyltransferase [unclassified Paenibacillus]MDQ1235965.1 ribosomal protein S18 acetylase RimI-like enzyme [Paenibacillus sp. SORGH_AS_0306]MDR6113014.1 ribosomal protein S18 acetylase RimI-like enzyme [Paenibacillus sp. SORGH_AS_0338]WDF51396.1 GNAT family N-acetyltransferase [Paenibacillus sp. KACC 21273]
MSVQPVDQLVTRLSIMNDAQYLIEIDHLVWNDNNTPCVLQYGSRQQYLQDHPPGTQLVAILGEQICGYVGFQHPTYVSTNQHVYDIHIAIHPDYQGKGIGRKLIESLGEFARSQQIRKLTLRVLSTNKEAFQFYKKLGFVENGRLPEEFYINGQYVDDILMTYWL